MKFTITNRDGEQFRGETIGEPTFEFAPVTWDRAVPLYDVVTEIAMQWGRGFDIWDYLAIQRDSRNKKVLSKTLYMAFGSRWYWIKSNLYEMKENFDMWLYNMKNDFKEAIR